MKKAIILLAVPLLIGGCSKKVTSSTSSSSKVDSSSLITSSSDSSLTSSSSSEGRKLASIDFTSLEANQPFEMKEGWNISTSVGSFDGALKFNSHPSYLQSPVIGATKNLDVSLKLFAKMSSTSYDISTITNKIEIAGLDEIGKVISRKEYEIKSIIPSKTTSTPDIKNLTFTLENPQNKIKRVKFIYLEREQPINIGLKSMEIVEK